MCKFCNYSEGNVADEDIIDKRIRIGEIPDALSMEIYVNEDYDGKGITDCQINISKDFPDEYATMTEKVVEAFENH